ncbi:MAG TPA: hypothetical protein PKC66_09140 [Leptospiraceae bacterium]|nr:hypothetical protein [Leptospiraceae bacterium]HNL72015.1 hypothetical protein [Leptospiraceae bacterium]
MFLKVLENADELVEQYPTKAWLKKDKQKERNLSVPLFRLVNRGGKMKQGVKL